MTRGKQAGRKHGTMRTVTLLIGVTLLTFGGVFTYDAALTRQSDADAQKVTQLTQLLTDKQAKKAADAEEKKRQVVYVTLPNADPIKAPIENYDDPTHLWTLVNKQRALPMNYIPADLMMPELSTRANSTPDEKKVRAVMSDALIALFGDASKAGHDLMIGSAYRSSATQAQLFNSYVASAGLEEASKYSAHAGHSEHQTGLAVDISTTSQQCYLSACFIDTADGQWLAENAHKYGFTLRYPNGKEAITGYNFEPWHYRYVGVDLATALKQSDLTLDQAWPYLQEALKALRGKGAL